MPTIPQERLSFLVEQFLISALLADSVIVSLVGQNVFPDSAPLGSGYPVIILQRVPSSQYGDDIIFSGNAKLGATYSYRVKCGDVGRSKMRAIQVAQEINRVLHGLNGPAGVYGRSIADVKQEREYSAPYFDQASNQDFQQEGSEFSVFINNA